MTLVELERLIHQAVKSEIAVPEAASALGCDPDRLAIYQRMVEGHIVGTLDGIFEVLKALIEPARWQQIESAYLAECPPSHWSLNHAGEALPEFLEACCQQGRFGLTELDVCLAQLEWEIMATALNAAPMPGLECGALPIINPTLSILSQPFELVPFLIGVDAGEKTRSDAPPRRENDAIALLFQRPGTLHCAYYQADDQLLFALKAVSGGLSTAEAATVSGQPQALVDAAYTRAIEIGLLLSAPLSDP